jgi:hypothetical protein
MEQRRENRFKPNQIATLTVLGVNSGASVIQACILDISGSGMGLRSGLPIPCGAQVEIKVGQTVSHGSVCRCEPMGDAYEVGVQVAMTEVLTAKD